MAIDAQAPPAADPAAPARLAACPDCGGQVSTRAPVCIHCGGPLAPSAARRPMAGIVAALALGVPGMALAALVIVSPYNTDGIRTLYWVAKGVHVAGTLALVVGALMSLGGNPRGNRVARAAAVGMIAAVLVMLPFYWGLLVAQGIPDGASGQPTYGSLILFLAVIGTAPWWLFLFLFRRSRHP